MDPKVKIRVNASIYVRLSGGLNHLPYLLSISVSMAVIKDFRQIKWRL